MLRRTLLSLAFLYPLALGRAYPYQNFSGIDFIQERSALHCPAPLSMLLSLREKVSKKAALKREIAGSLATQQDKKDGYPFEEENDEFSCGPQGFCQ